MALAIPVAIAVNAVRVFLTGFLVYFVDPKLGEGFMHLTEGWLLFVVAFVILGAAAWIASSVEEPLAVEDARMREWQRYVPAAILGLGCLLLTAGNTQQVAMSLAAPLSSLPAELDGYAGRGPPDQ